jgi:hypothetical protein
VITPLPVKLLAFINALITSKVTANKSENINLSPVVIDNTSRVVLRWNLLAPRPLDLDIYALNTLTRERVYYSAKTSPSGQLKLDVDNMSTGPETITISASAVDPIQIFVRSYNKLIPIMNSGAQVDIYRGNNLVKSLKVPIVAGSEASQGWELGLYNPKDGTLAATNKLLA